MTHRNFWFNVAASMTLMSLSLLSQAQSNANDVPVRINIRDGIGSSTEGTDRMIVKYRDGGAWMSRARAFSAKPSTSLLAAQVAANRQGLRFSVLRQTAMGSHVFQLSRALSYSEAVQFAESLRAGDSNIEYAELDKVLVPQAIPNDAMYAQQWSLSDATGGIRAPAAWDKSTGSGVTVAVIDTGVRPHADLVANLLPGYDFIKDLTVAGDGNGRDADAADPGDGVVAGACGTGSPASNSSWHGTHVSGIVAAVAGNGTGVAGVAYGAKVLPLRAVGRCGGYASDVADAIVWASGTAVAGLPTNTTPARVINLSLGGNGVCDVTTQNAINAARAKGSVVVVAAGNANTNASTSSPANCAGVVTVAATAKSGGKASYSNFGANVTLAAPGGDRDAGIWSTLNAGTMAPGADAYAAYAGTSMATPVVSGVVALMLSANKNLTPDQVASLLKSTARAFPQTCASCGAGIVDAAAAVAAAASFNATPTPSPAPSPSPTPGPTAGNEVEPNDSIAAAQVITALPYTVKGSIGSDTDTDYFKISILPGKKVTLTLTAGASSGFGLGVYLTSGQQLALLPGAVGRTVQIQLGNSGTSAVSVAVRVLRSTGTAGGYSLTMAY